MFTVRRLVVIAFTYGALLSSCAGPGEALGDPEHDARSQAAPNEAERRAARLLSLTNNSSLDAKSDPYERAVLCVVAIDSLQERLRNAFGITGDQKRALAVARGVYERRADSAKAAGANLRGDIEKADSEAEDAGELARTGVSCLRQLA